MSCLIRLGLESTIRYTQGPSLSWSYGNWNCNYLCNQYLSPLMLWVRISIRARCTTLYGKVGGLLLVLRFSPPIKLTAMIYLKYCWNKQTSKQICKKRNKLKKSSFSNYYTIPRMNIHPRLIALNMLQVYQKYMQAICQDNKRCVRIQHFTIGQHMHWSFHIFQSFQTNSK